MAEGNAVPVKRWNVGGHVWSVVASQDGTRAASGSGDNYVRIWDIHTGEVILGPLMGHTMSIESVAFSPNNSFIISGSADSFVRVWDAHTGTPMGKPLGGHTASVFSVATLHDSSCIVSGSADRTIRLWDVRTSHSVSEPLREHTGYVRSVKFSPDGHCIVSGSNDHTIRIWDVRAGKPIGGPLNGHTQPVYSVDISPNGTRIVSGSYDHTIRIWNLRTRAPVGRPLLGHASNVHSVAFSPDNTRIVSGSWDNTVRFWDARTGAPLGQPFEGHTSIVNTVTFLPDSSGILSGSSDDTICVWQDSQSAPSYNMHTEHESPSFDMVTSRMSAQEMFDCLINHGCADLSSLIDSHRFSSSAIASGAFGDVWQAWLDTGILVAVKSLRLHVILEGDEKGMKRMARELHHWSKARHENIQELLGITMFQDRLGMVSLWMENGNLQQYIERNPSVDRYQLCAQLANGVAYMHGIGMVHGDIKAVNVLVSADGVVKISDFDYSILSESTLRFTETSKVGGGTVRWMAPELLLHQGDKDGDSPPIMRNMKTDVYALGMTMLETISGLVPYHQIMYEAGIIYALIRKQPPKRPEQLSGPEERAKRMWALLLTCWNHDPSARPDAFFILQSLQSFVI